MTTTELRPLHAVKPIAQKAAAAKLGRSWCFKHETYPISLDESGLTVGHEPIANPELEKTYMRTLRFNAYGIRSINVVPMDASDVKKKLVDLFGAPAPQRTESATTQLWHEIVLKAREYNVANILVEPTPNGGRVRFDVDGDAEEHFTLEYDQYEKLVTFIVRDIGDFKAPIGQRGRVKVEIDGTEIYCRLSTFPIWNPTGNGVRTKLVLRVQRSYELIPDLRSLGMEPDQITRYKAIMAHPNACIINGAPTGHGKSTTTYAGILLLDIERQNIYAIENPPEINVMPLGISQTEVFDSSQDENESVPTNLPVWTYRHALSELLRQDPKFAFVGECIDTWVTKTVLNSSITGIPMATTIHAFDALAIVDCLRARDVNNYLIAKGVTALISQRLVKHLCEQCREPVALSQRLVDDASQYGILLTPQTSVYARSQTGCPDCYQRSTFGRSAVFEIIDVTPDLKNAIRENADDQTMMRLARTAGYVTMFERAVTLLLRGIIDEEEVYKRFSPPQAVVGRSSDTKFLETLDKDIIVANARGILERREARSA